MPTEHEIKEWYNHQYKEHDTETMRPFEAYPIFLNFLNVLPEKKILDVSCGTGYLLKAASDKNLNTTGIDISEEAVAIAKKISPDSDIRVGRGEALPFKDNEFDYVSCLGALEHFLDMSKGLQEMKRVACDDATFCIMVPNSEYFFWKLSGAPGTAQQDINEHLLPLGDWKKFFKENGFDIIKIHHDRWVSKEIRVFSSGHPFAILKGILFKLVWLFLPLRYTYQFIFILKKTPRD